MPLQGLGESFSMFSVDSSRPKISSAEGGRSSSASIWGDAQSRAANLEQYNQMLQQGPALRSSLDSRSSGGLFGGELCLHAHHSSAVPEVQSVGAFMSSQRTHTLLSGLVKQPSR